MVYVGAKVWGKCPFFGDSIFLFLMYDVWLLCVFYAACSVPTSVCPASLPFSNWGRNFL